jgi:hypothetical protein
MISLFDYDDEEMLTCKFGNWWELNPQRGRSNNSAVIKRNGVVSKEDFMELWKKVELSNSGEPGFYFTNDVDLGTNPCCFAGSELLLTSDGYKRFDSLVNIDFTVVDSSGSLKQGKVWKTGVKNVIRLFLENTTTIDCTPDHIFLSDGREVPAIDLLDKNVVSYHSEEPVRVIDINHIEAPVDVYDFNINGDNHWGVVNGVIAHNCEISLNSFQFCNLVEINASDLKDQHDFEERTAAAAFIGTLQASYTDFHYLRPEWKEVTEREALLGIGMTGIASGAVLNLDMPEAAEVAYRVNRSTADEIGIKSAHRITCVKPSGTSSLVLGTSSGVHAWHDQYYIRRMRLGKNEALYTYLAMYHPELIEDDVLSPSNQAVVSVPVAAPEGAITRASESAIQFLERVKLIHEKWIKPGHVVGENTHNVSATVTLKNNEWKIVGEWLWENQNHYNGLSFLPEDLGSYQQTPFETITKEEYEKMSSGLSGLSVANIVEINDNTNLMGEQACSGGACEIS